MKYPLKTALWLLLLFSYRVALPVESGKDFFVWQSDTDKTLRVFVSKPDVLTSGTPVVFVMHGQGRNADEYRDQWHDLAMKHSFLLIVPEFNKAQFPGSRSYNFGNVLDENGAINPAAEWSFSLIEPIFDAVRLRYSLQQSSYGLYGHSAGAQFVHRFLLHIPQHRAQRIVIANAGSYTMPDRYIEFPYGLAGSAVTDEALRFALQSPVTILLGDRDIDPHHDSLPDAEDARIQGPHRFARGFSFFEAGRVTAEKIGEPFNWHLSTVRGVGHDNALMAPAAVVYLLP